MSYVALDIFQQLRQEDIHWILASSELRTLSPNSVLVREDDPSEAIFFIADGLFEVYVFARPDDRLKVGQLGPGEVIGEISWLDRKPVSASVRAVETSAVMALSTALLERKLAEDPGFATRFFRGIATLTAGRLRKTTRRLAPFGMGRGTARRPANAGSDGGVLEQGRRSSRRSLLPAEGKGAVPDDARAKIREMFDALDAQHPAAGREERGRHRRGAAGELVPLVELSAPGSRLLRQAARLCRRLPDHRHDLRQRAGRRRRRRGSPRRLRAEPAGGQGHPQPAAPARGGDPVVLPHGGRRSSTSPASPAVRRARSSTCSRRPTTRGACRSAASTSTARR